MTIAELEAKAKAANGFEGWYDQDCIEHFLTDGVEGTDGVAAFIVAASPATVAVLCDRLREAIRVARNLVNYPEAVLGWTPRSKLTELIERLEADL